MDQNQDPFAILSAALATSGLRILHSGAPADEWPINRNIQSVLIIGHAGSEFWPYFKDSPEFSDGDLDPLDRWSARVIKAAAPNMFFVSPSDGPPYAPIHELAEGGSMHPSPLGMLAHAEFGLWIAIRGLLLTTESLPRSRPTNPIDPDSFIECFNACPVNAFGNNSFDAGSCANHLINNETAECWSGCSARKACTVGSDWIYEDTHAKFYMDAFTSAMQKRKI